VSAMAKRKEALSETHVIVRRLPFVTVKETSVDYWDVQSSGREPDAWAKDCSLGRMHAMAAIEVMHKTEFTPLLGAIVQSMIKRGQFEGIEVGFLQCIADRATWPHE
jgi:hypothetical protein